RLAAPVWLLEDLAALMARRGLTAADSGELLFVNGQGRPLGSSPWRRSTWAPACVRAGLPGLRFHDLRSNAATALVAAGVDVKTAQTRLGHANPHTTLAIYARASAEADRRAAETVGDLFRPRDGRGIKRAQRAKS
ncbi:MAG TPA: tyrosine-type recombinase/integrase, partial [Acidimicrobiales bacterium]|nr:tyrosine-type recombinase/integrase [Acidimicrobiales bacterium]